MELNKTVLIVGSFASRSGYGNHSRDIARAFIDLQKFTVKLIPTQWGGTPNDALDQNNPKDRKIIEHFVHPESITEQPDIFVQISIPNEFNKNGKFNIGITAGIETTQCRGEWIEGCNRMDHVIVTSNHSKKVFELTKYDKRDKDGKVVGAVELTTPTTVLFEGVDLDIFKIVKTNHSLEVNKELDKLDEDFAFLFTGHWLQGGLGQDRKDVSGLIKTFLEAFKGRQPRNRPALVLKTSGAGFSEVELYEIKNKIQQIQNIVGNGVGGSLPTVKILYGDLTDEEMNELYNHPKIKAMVSFTKGEGFGRPLLEFTTTGKPVIASNWSGQVDFLKPEHSILLNGKLEQVHPTAANEWVMKESSWFTVDYNQAENVLRDVVDNYDDILKNTHKHIGITNNEFSYSNMVDELAKILDTILPSNDSKQNDYNIVLPKLTKV